MFSLNAFSFLSGSVAAIRVFYYFWFKSLFIFFLVKDWVLVVLGVVVFCSVVVWGIEWCMLCAGGCGIVDPRSVEETLQRGGQVPQHAGQGITSPLRVSSPQGLTHAQTHTHCLLQLCVILCAWCHIFRFRQTHVLIHTDCKMLRNIRNNGIYTNIMPMWRCT